MIDVIFEPTGSHSIGGKLPEVPRVGDRIQFTEPLGLREVVQVIWHPNSGPNSPSPRVVLSGRLA